MKHKGFLRQGALRAMHFDFDSLLLQDEQSDSLAMKLH
jgi:hypothetical protein